MLSSEADLREAIMQLRAVLLAAALVLAPLSAKGADLVVWWEQGFYPEEDTAVRETIAAFEQETGKDVELVLHPQEELTDRVQAAIEAGQPPDFLFGLVIDANIDPWAYDDRLVDLTEAVGPLVSMFDPDVLEASKMLNGRTGQRGLYGLPFGRSTNHVHVWKSLLEQAGFTLADIPKEWEEFWSFWCDRVQPAVRQATGREDIWAVGLSMSVDSPGDTWNEFTQFKYAYDSYWGASANGRNRVADPTARDTDPAARASLIKALDSYTAFYRKGCSPPDATGWDNRGNNEAFLTQRVVMTPNETLSTMNALRGSRPDDYVRNAATIEWPNDVAGRPLVIYGEIYRAAVFKTGRNPALAGDFVRFLLEDGWLAHYLDFARDRLLPPMTKLIDSPFWLDPSDPHRMASVMQALTQPHVYDTGAMSDRVWDDKVWHKAVHRVAAEGISPEQAVDEAIARIKQILSE
jgi:multiple sugar transport system substrate-binding protein